MSETETTQTQETTNVFQDIQYPRVKALLEQVVQRSGLSADEIKKTFDEKVNSEYVLQNIGQDEKARYDYVAGLLITKWSKRSPMAIFDVIPLGHEGVRQTTTKKLVASIIAVVIQEGKQPVLNSITFWDREAKNISSSVEYGSLYKSVKLSQNTQSGNLTGDNRTAFENPQDVDAKQVYGNLGITRSGLRELFKNPSKLNASGYAIKEDIRMIEGFVKRYNEGLKKKSNPDSEDEWDFYRMYNIHMKTAEGDMQLSEVLEDGTVLNEELAIWVPKDQAGIPEGSLIQAIGNVKIGKDNQTGNLQPTFNAYHVRTLLLEEKDDLE